MDSNFENYCNGEYSYRYLANSVNAKITKFKYMNRVGSPQSDWTGGAIWDSPVVALAPPRINDHGLALNIDTYVNYMDKKINSRSNSYDYKLKDFKDVKSARNCRSLL